MKSPKAPKETAEQRATRLAEEQRIKTLQARADAEEAAAGRQLMTRRTRRVMRMFGARQVLAGLASPAAPGQGQIGFSAPTPSSSLPLGYGGGGGGGGGGRGFVNLV